MPVQFRLIREDELHALLDLYTHLAVNDLPLPEESVLAQVWESFIGDPKISCVVGEADGQIVASCTLIVVPNFTRAAHPYALIENVVTHAAWRKQGIGTALLRHTLEMAWEAGCYKAMLLSGRKEEEVMRFYEHAGFVRGEKTGFVAHPEWYG
jgi:GNAT superfamily N-acetyltransferase